MVVAEEPSVERNCRNHRTADRATESRRNALKSSASVPSCYRYRKHRSCCPRPTPNRSAASHPAPDHATPQDAQLAEPRLAAKWPFERAVTNNSAMVTLNVDNADVRTVFEMLARGYQMNILVSPDVEGTVTANVDGLTPEQTLQGIVKMCNLNMQQDENLIYIYPSTQLPADARQSKSLSARLRSR